MAYFEKKRSDTSPKGDSMNKQQVKLAFEKAIKYALDKHLSSWSIKTLDFVNASQETTDFYIARESEKLHIA